LGLPWDKVKSMPTARSTVTLLLAMAAASFLLLRVLEALKALDVVLEIHQDHARTSLAPTRSLPATGGSGETGGELLVRQPLPNCSVLFFHHLEKSAGTTLRSIMQRQAQLGHFDSIVYIGRLNKQLNQLVLHRLSTLLQTPGGLTNLRLLVEIHIGGNRDHPYFIKYTLPDLLLLRDQLRKAGCRCNLVTLLRHPLLQHLSWHFHFCNHRVPLCFWSNPTDCQSRMAMALTCHDGPNLAPLSERHHAALEIVWRTFDLVGTTEQFDEFLILLTDLVGLQAPAYRRQQVATETLDSRRQTASWTARPCAELMAAPPAELMTMLERRLAKSAENAANHQRRRGRSSTRGEAGTMECRGYGPCEVPGWSARQKVADGQYNATLCAAVTARDVLRRLCARMAIDESTYLSARRRFERSLAALGSSLQPRLRLLCAAGDKLHRRAAEQAATPLADLERAADAHDGELLLRSYTAHSGEAVGGPWGPVDERATLYQPHERARFSCQNCSGDVVPAKDLIGCWPLWTQFAPDEMRYRCSRSWTSDPGWHRPRAYLEEGARLPCWRTCWTLSGAAARDDAPQRPHCTAPCPLDAPPALQWRREWDAALEAFNAEPGIGRELAEAMAFVRAQKSRDFFWGIY
jgi:hypothetical protein